MIILCGSTMVEVYMTLGCSCIALMQARMSVGIGLIKSYVHICRCYEKMHSLPITQLSKL